MRGKDEQQLGVFSYLSPRQQVPQDHPLRPLRVMTDEALRSLRTEYSACNRGARNNFSGAIGGRPVFAYSL